MQETRFRPSKLFYFGSWDGIGPLRSSNTNKLRDADGVILPLDFAKDHFKYGGSSSPFISLFEDLSALKAFRRIWGEKLRYTTKPILCEIDVSKTKATKLYRVTDIVPGMGSVATGSLPDFLALHQIPREAVTLIPMSSLS